MYLNYKTPAYSNNCSKKFNNYITGLGLSITYHDYMFCALYISIVL